MIFLCLTHQGRSGASWRASGPSGQDSVLPLRGACPIPDGQLGSPDARGTNCLLFYERFTIAVKQVKRNFNERSVTLQSLAMNTYSQTAFHAVSTLARSLNLRDSKLPSISDITKL